MKKINLNTFFPITVLILLIFFLSNQMFKLPPFGKVLNPFIGVVQNNETGRKCAIVNSSDLNDSVAVFFDSRDVPHIFANNTHDLYYTQGFITAQLRLWQMDFLTYVSAGRLSEIFTGNDYFNYDRKQRRMGILNAAKKSLAFIEKDSLSKSVLTAYTEGVNAYIKTLNYKNYPIEYKLLDYEPEPWTNLKSVLIIKYMASVLSGYEEDIFQSKMMLALGKEDFSKLYPDFHSYVAPIVQYPDTNQNNFSYIKPSYLDYGFLSKESEIAKSEFNPNLGSNAWAVSGQRTKTGSPILCSDPHLNLNLPSIWLEMQLSNKDQNVYGVSIPGTPAVIIGFNKDVAWGLTNGNTDVKDWYKLEISNNYTQYELNKKQVKLQPEIEIIGRREQTPFYDTIYYSNFGPIVFCKDFVDKNLMNLALKWQLHEPSNEFKTFLLLNQAKNYNDYKIAIKNYACPIQDFVFASKDGTISIDHQGKIPVRNKGEGKFIFDGKSASTVKKYIPQDSLPNSLNPLSGYVIGANQHPTNKGYKYFYNGYYIETRANQIKKCLAGNSKLDIDSMKKIQLDNVNPIASLILPKLISILVKKVTNEDEKKILQLLQNWNGKYEKDRTEPLLFSELWRNLTNLTWDELREYKFYQHSPEDYVLVEFLLNDPNNKFFDKKGTQIIENANDIVNEAFINTLKTYSKLKKENTISWGDFNKVSIMHLTNLIALSHLGVEVNGHQNAINAMAGASGPSWRMVVELGETPKAYGIYPGGQSGNFGNIGYDSFVKSWVQEKYYSLNYFSTVKDAKNNTNIFWSFNSTRQNK